MVGLSIGEVASAAGCNTASIRYYEDIGLLPKAGRRQGGHRVYGREDLSRLRFIRRSRDFGFSIPQIRELLAVSDGSPCAEARAIAQARLDEVRRKLVEMRSLEIALRGFVSRCDDTCAGGTADGCTIYDDLEAAGPDL